jgi:hypothetical protein
MAPRQPPYSAEDTATVIKWYPIEGTDVVLRLKHPRSRPSVATFANTLRERGLMDARIARSPWTNETESILIHHFPRIGPVGCFDLFKGVYTIFGIKSKARRLRLSAPRLPTRKKDEPPEVITDAVDPNEADTAPMIHRHIPEGEWKRDHPIPRRSVFDVEARA